MSFSEPCDSIFVMSTNDREASRLTATGAGPDELSRLLEIELIQKRSEWQRASTRHKSIRSASFVFLFVVVMAALVGFYFLFTRASEGRQHRATAAPTDSVTP